MSTSNLREIEDNRDVSGHENTHLSDRRDGSAQNRGRQREIHRDSRYARNPLRRRSLHRNLNPSPPSGRLNGQTTPRDVEKELRERDEEIAHLQSQLGAMREAIARRDGRIRGRSPGRRETRRVNVNGASPSPTRRVDSRAGTTGHASDRRAGRLRGNLEPTDWGKWLDDELNRRDQRPTVRTAQDIAKKALDQIASTPFIEEIEARRPPRKFIPPQFIPYDGKSDPISHIRHYKQMMALWSRNESLMCRVFSSSLGESALRWFHKLPFGTVSSWKQLAELFTARFIANSEQPKEVDYLLTIQMKAYEGLRQYARRYWEAYNEIDECSEQLAVTQFKIGLPREHRLRQSLAKRPALGMPELMQRIEQHSRLEEDLSLSQENSDGESSEVEKPLYSPPQLGTRSSSST